MTVRDSTPRIHVKMQDAKTIEGGYYKPEVDEEGVLRWTPSKEHMPELPESNIKGKPGKDGTDANVTTENITRALGYTPADEGDVNQLKQDLEDLESDGITWIEGNYINTKGGESVNGGYKCTDFIECYIGYNFKYKCSGYKNISTYALYDENKEPIKLSISESANLVSVEGTINPLDYNARYIRFTAHKSEETYVKVTSLLSARLGKKVINTDNLIDGAVTVDKIDFKKHDPDTNFINGWVENAYINKDGVEVAYMGFYASKPIYLESGKTYYKADDTILYYSYWSFYSEDGTPIESEYKGGGLPSPFVCPEGASYLRVTCVTKDRTEKAWVSTKDGVPKPYSLLLDTDKLNVKSTVDIENVDNPCDYLGDEICTFTRCLCIGDSLTVGTMNHNDSGSTEYISYDKYSFPRILERITGIEVTNKGLGGHSSAEWYEAESSTDLSGYDIAIIQLGVNDAIRYSKFGDTSKTAFTNIINKLKSENKNIKIFVANIIPALSYSSDGMLIFSNDLLDWVTSTYADDKDVIPLDIQQYGHTKDLNAYNCGHLSAYGYYRLAKDYKSYISYYMMMNPNVFKEIQFIGTDYWYDNPNN